MKDIDWSKAPEGATHWVGSMHQDPMNPWEKHTDGKRYIWIGKKGRWDESNMDSLKIHDVIIERHAQWQGPQDGLPPVGTWCELETLSGSWRKCEILAHRNGRAIFYAPHTGSASTKPASSFRQIKSDRDRLIEAAMKFYTPGITETWMRKLYDAGMLVDPERKPMSRAEAKSVLVGLKGTICKDVPLMSEDNANTILDALGYKE